jgi:hypothetical protein
LAPRSASCSKRQYHLLPDPKEEGGDLVDVTVFGPTAIQAGGEGLIQVLLHTLGQRKIAKALAKEADP